MLSSVCVALRSSLLRAAVCFVLVRTRCGIFERIVTRSADFHRNQPMDVQLHFPMDVQWYVPVLVHCSVVFSKGLSLSQWILLEMPNGHSLELSNICSRLWVLVYLWYSAPEITRVTSMRGKCTQHKPTTGSPRNADLSEPEQRGCYWLIMLFTWCICLLVYWVY